jgi:formylglycine-generating enzyme required for sulfatase activity
MAGYNPSEQGPEMNLGGKQFNLLHPVEQVGWGECRLLLGRFKLRLPSEAEWEYAARAGTTTVWWTGDEVKSMDGADNLCDLTLKNNGGPGAWPYEEWLEDGYVTHAPVGIYRPNPFGLHNVIGNVVEWCHDSYWDYAETPIDGSPADLPDVQARTFRGGSWADTADTSRSARRNQLTPEGRSRNLGVRPAYSL